ncbi:MAG: phosphate ABC transporter substrate-binding protein [Nitrospira sp.]|nr:phosphate ABC transporter substrate-binding protein [Nitrospira sp.]
MKGVPVKFSITTSSLCGGALLGALVSTVPTAYADNVIVLDPAVKGYVKVTGMSGNVNSIGSDTLNNLITLWAEGFRKQYPSVKIQIEGKGSSTAPPALIEGTAQLGPMSRPMKSTEADSFERKFGYKPTAFSVAIDALALYVNKDNSIRGLTMAQLDAIFSKTRRGGASANLDRWKQLGLTGEVGESPISMYGRNSASGTYGFFKEYALKNGDFKDEVKEQPGSASVVQGVTEDIAGIGYSGIGYLTSGVRLVPLAEKDGAPFVAVTQENTMNGSYPLWRHLLIYVNKAPNKPLDPLIKEFLKFIYSKEGQMIVIKDGFFPLSQAVIAKELAKLE